MESADEESYIKRIKDGDPAPYRFIVDRYKHMAYTIAVRILGNEEDAQDAAQESFIKAYQQIGQFAFKSKFSTWLYTIVYRTAISKLNKRHVKILSISESMDESYVTDPDLLMPDQMQIADEQRYVKMAIQRLPQTEALLVTLFYINENTIREIRDITGYSLPNIKIKLFRARKKLERELKFLIDHDNVVSENEKERSTQAPYSAR